MLSKLIPLCVFYIASSLMGGLRPPSNNEMKLTSPAFEHNGMIPNKYTCPGQERSPPLEISHVPSQAKSLVLIMEDPDVPKDIREDGLWVHWIVFNINPKTTTIAENAQDFGTLGQNTEGTFTYQGPCPPSGEHRYVFKLYALDTSLDLPEGVNKQELVQAMEGHLLAVAELMGRYKKIR